MMSFYGYDRYYIYRLNKEGLNMETDIHRIVSKQVVKLSNAAKAVGTNNKEGWENELVEATNSGDYIKVMAIGLILFKLNFKKN